MVPFESQAHFLRDARNAYRRIKSVSCPVFNYKPIYFNKHGFNHLISKQRLLRSKREQIRRVNLLPCAVILIESAHSISGYKKTVIDSSVGHFWILKGNIEGKNIRVIIRQLNQGNKHFFSVMDE